MRYYFVLFLIFSIWRISSPQEIENYQFFSDSISVIFKDADSVSFGDYFDDQKKIDSISKLYSNWHKRALAIEDYQLSKTKSGLIIDNNNRIVKLKNGNKIILKLDSDKDEVEYNYEKSLLHGDLLLFRVQWLEGNNYFILNTINGDKTYTFGRVYISPNQDFLISINNDIVAGYSSNGLELFSINKDYKIKKLWEHEPTVWGPINIKWLSNNTLIVHGYYIDTTKDSKHISFYKKIEINVP